MKKDKKTIYKGIKPEFTPAGKTTDEEVFKIIESVQRKLSKMKPEDIPEMFKQF